VQHFFWHAAVITPGVAAGWGERTARPAQTATELGYGQRLGIGLLEKLNLTVVVFIELGGSSSATAGRARLYAGLSGADR